MMLTGRRQIAGLDFPEMEELLCEDADARERRSAGHIVITPGGGGGPRQRRCLSGPKYARFNWAMATRRPTRSARWPDRTVGTSPARLPSTGQRAVPECRRTAVTEAFTYSYEQALKLMQKKDVFDVSKEPAADHERYGKHDFGRHCLLARRLLESGVGFVQLAHSNYDTTTRTSTSTSSRWRV